MSCAQCHASVPAGSRFCPHCGTATTPGGVLTMTSSGDETTRLQTTPAATATRLLNSAWATASGSIDHGRFEPGLMLDGRYRVLGLLGRGGMGEVYRADDLRLGQQVALKFLPASLTSDPVRLAQFHNEVRTARQVSHPNVCNIAELLEQHRAGTITAPTAIVKSLDPAIEAAILRCLDPIAVRRPSSAIAVSAALPGGDPLAAALAAGETPSPEMVAAAGGEGAALSVAAGVAWLAIAIAAVVTTGILTARYSLITRIPLTRSAAVIGDRAEEIRQNAGYPAASVDSALGYGYDNAYLTWAAAHGRDKTGWTELEAAHAGAIVHRDIKPGNILIARRNTRQMIRVVLDWYDKYLGPVK